MGGGGGGGVGGGEGGGVGGEGGGGRGEGGGQAAATTRNQDESLCYVLCSCTVGFSGPHY